jgi:hypothetical protein
METNEARLRQSVEALCMTYGFIAVSKMLDSIKIGIDVTLGAFGFAAIDPSTASPVQSAQRESKVHRVAEVKEKAVKAVKAVKAPKPEQTGKRTRNISDAARQRIAEAQKRRWAKYRKDTQNGQPAPARKPRAAKSAATPVADTPASPAQSPQPIDGIVAPSQDDAFTREFDALVSSGTALDTNPQQ